MPLRVRYQNDDTQECTIRPTPLVAIQPNVLRTGAGEQYGVTYTITLRGDLLDNMGTPYAYDTQGNVFDVNGGTTPNYVGPYSAFDNNISHFDKNRPPTQQVPVIEASHAIFFKQQVLRSLFAQDGQRVEITDFNDDEASLVFYPRVVGIDFEEGIYVQRCRYTITLECDTILDKDVQVNTDGSLVAFDGVPRQDQRESDLLAALSGCFIQGYNEDWTLEVDEANPESPDNPRSYRITHNLNATGKTHYTPNDDETEITKLVAWEQARKFVHQRLADNISDYPNVMGLIGSGTVNLVNSYGGFNHVRTENISESDGTYGVSETWLLSSGTAYEQYNSSVTSSISSPFVTVSVNGSVTGMSQVSPSGFGGNQSGAVTAFENALSKYNAISNNGNFGLGSNIYSRANNLVDVQLNSQPTNVTLGVNEFQGTIDYSLEFNNRPTNIISGVLTENIQIADGNPGDNIAIIPVPGRATGPILNNVGGRQEYTRDVTIDLLLDYTDVPYGSGRNPLLLKKPSVVEPTATQLANLLKELSPQGEPGVRKYFIPNRPGENWNPKEGQYSMNISWVYELDK